VKKLSLFKTAEENALMIRIREIMMKKIPITKPRLFNFLYMTGVLKEDDIKKDGDYNKHQAQWRCFKIPLILMIGWFYG
jgi:phage antirepressor YoqD-like protein